LAGKEFKRILRLRPVGGGGTLLTEFEERFFLKSTQNKKQGKYAKKA
jgi:hypothetical protein